MKINGVLISLENRKLGPIPSVSLMPALSCGKGCGPLLCMKLCYARSMLRYTFCGKSWTENFNIWKRNPIQYFYAIRTFLRDHEPRKFRWHVAGDIPNLGYYKQMVAIALEFPETQFLAFSKAYRFLWTGPNAPGNLTVIASRWPGMPLPKAMKDPDAYRVWCDSFPQAWMQPHDHGQPLLPGIKPIPYEIPKTATHCPGSCITCKRCWGLKPGQDVVFDQH